MQIRNIYQKKSTMNKHYHSKITFLLFFLMGLINSSCGEDRRVEYYEETKVDRWIESTMRQHYYWYEDMPSSSDEKLNYFSPPKDFLNSLLSKNDGKRGRPYSYIENLLENGSQTRSIHNIKNSYGFEFASYTDYKLRVLYVVKNSPASDVGLKRGDWILSINGEKITDSWIDLLLNGGESLELGIGAYDEENKEFKVTKTITLPPSRPIEDNPIYLNDVLTVENHNIGYIVYNHFTPHKIDTDEDNIYDNQLREISKKFKTQGIKDLVLDLRYNNGGYLTSASLLCEILAPASAKGNTMYSLEYNDKQKNPWDTYYFNQHYLGDGVNLDLKTLYVLVSSATASASELIINCLDPYMKVVLIGTQTEGKNVGSTTYTHEDGEWALHPIIFKIYNSEEKSEYKDGFKPDIPFNDLELPNKLHELGDPNEALLKRAIGKIIGKPVIEQEKIRSRSQGFSLQLAKSSIAVKATPILIK